MINPARPSAPPESELVRLINLFNAGHLSEVEGQAHLLVAQYPKCAPAWKLLGASQQMQGKNGLMALRKSVELQPKDPLAHCNLGNALKELGYFEDAVASYRRALKLKPDFAGIHYNMGLAMMDLVRIEDALSCYRRAIALKPDFTEAYSSLLAVLNYTTKYTSSYCLSQAKQYGQMVTSKASGRFTSWQCNNRPERLRVGIVSGDLRNHPVGHFLEGLLKELDSHLVELIAYPTHSNEDDLSARIKPSFSTWKSLVGLNDHTAARLIHADGVNVLLDLSGHTRFNRLPIFAWKPAPIQASWLGYYATTGMAEMDYLLADHVGVPEALRDQFTETVYYLPDTRLCFTPPRFAPLVTPLPSLANGYVTFGCFQNIFKIGDNVLATWGEIFQALPSSKLRIQCGQFKDRTQIAQMTMRLKRNGINPSHVIMCGWTSREDYLSAHNTIDLILDTFPFPGGTTTCEALWMGVPTLTLQGDSMLSRQGASLLTAAGLEAWISSSQEEYIAKAISFAGDLSGLAALRANLRNKVSSSPLFDAARFARNLEKALWGMWEKHYRADQSKVSL